jgi:hypothetical protein
MGFGPALHAYARTAAKVRQDGNPIAVKLLWKAEDGNLAPLKPYQARLDNDPVDGSSGREGDQRPVNERAAGYASRAHLIFRT